MTAQIISQEYLQEIFDYKDGHLYWKKLGKGRKVSLQVGSLDKDGYIQLSINGKKYKEHRLVYIMHHGQIPKIIDHIDGNPANNCIENLREATLSENQYNRKLGKDNTSGFKNVSWCKKMKKWYVSLKVNGAKKYFGSYKDIDYAKFVAETMRYKYHGKFLNHGN
jgi:hypothetical protein